MYFSSPLIALLESPGSASTAPGYNIIQQATNGPDQGTFIWICSSNRNPAHCIPEGCSNMYYGAYCRDFGALLTWDDHAGNTKNERANTAGCGEHNHCTASPPGIGSYQCDSYPFGSANDADRTDILPVNHYVARNHVAGQGARLNQLINSKGPAKNSRGLDGTPPAKFQQSFANAGELAYCNGNNKGDDCHNVGLQYDKRGIIVDSVANCSDLVPREHLQYRLRNGQIIVVPDEFEVGHRVWLPREYNSTLLVEQSEAYVYDHARGMEQFEHMVSKMYVEDFVGERLSEGYLSQWSRVRVGVVDFVQHGSHWRDGCIKTQQL